jgi:membrane-bound ClpP family serine protease
MGYFTLLSRRQKRSKKKIFLIGATGLVDKSLSPHGSILIQGELWPARSFNGDCIKEGTLIRVIKTGGIYLKVEAIN